MNEKLPFINLKTSKTAKKVLGLEEQPKSTMHRLAVKLLQKRFVMASPIIGFVKDIIFFCIISVELVIETFLEIRQYLITAR